MRPLRLPSPRPRGGSRDHPGGLGEGAIRERQDVPECLVHGEDTSRDSPASQPGYSAFQVDGPGSQAVLAVPHARGLYGVGDETDAVGAEHADGEGDHLGVDVESVGDEAADYPRVGEGGSRETGLAVVRGAHGVEEVRNAGYRRVERLVCNLERGIGVSRTDDHSALRAIAMSSSAPSSSGARVSMRTGPRSRRRASNLGSGATMSRGVRAASIQVYERALEVYAQHLRAGGGSSDRRCELGQGLLV